MPIGLINLLMLTNEVTIKREFFLSCLFIEDMISNYIQEMFGETITKKVLGNEKLFSTFSEKIEFLMEVGNFSIIDNSKLSVFREIRRELLVSDDTESLEDSFTSPDNNDDFLLILYPQGDFLPRNEKLTVACYKLLDDVSQLVSNFTSKKEIKLNSENNLVSRVQSSAGRFSRVAMFFSLFMFK